MFPTEWLLPLLLLISLGVIAILFLPSLLEIKKPKDKGPRRMAETTIQQIVGGSQVFGSLSAPRSSTEHNPPFIRLIGDKEFSSGSEMKENVVVEGSLTTGNRCSFLRSVKAFGNVTVGSDVFIGENLVAKGNVNLGKGTVVNGSIDSQGSVKLGENVFVGCSVVASGDVELQENSEVRRSIFAGGCIRVAPKPKLDLKPSVLERPKQ